MLRQLIGFLACTLALPLASAQNLDSSKIDTEKLQIEREVSSENKATDKKESKTPSATSNKGVERLEVTGSYIKRIDVEGPSPMVTIDSEMFTKTGTNTVNDLIRENPLFESSEDEGSRSGYFRFHGQHAGNTLVLLNGLRIPKMGAPGRDFFNGVRGIPSNVIDKVDILKDGSSALYGSDAMAGVINFVTKKDYDGAEFSVQSTIPQEGVGIEQNYSATFGKNYSRGNWLTSLQYVSQDSYTESDIGSYYREPTANYGPSHKLTQINKDGSRGKTLSQKNAQCDGDRCDFNTLDQDFVRTPKENLSALLTGRMDVNSDLNVSALVMYNRRQKSYSEISTININPQSAGIQQVSLDSKLGQSLVGQQDADSSGFATLAYDPGLALGNRNSNLVEDSYTFQSRVQGYFADTWSWSVEGTGGFQTETTNYTSGIVDTGLVAQGLEQGTMSLNDPQAGSFNNAVRNPREEYNSQMVASRVFATGEIGDFQNIWGAGGALAIAFGADAQWEGSSDNNDLLLSSGDLNINRPVNLEGSRQVQSFFTELSAYPLESVELQLAGRYDNYSDFGDTFNPKIAMAYRPSKTVLFRTSWGTNFHAPSVRNMITPPNTTFEFFRDEGQCANTDNCTEQSRPYQVTRYKDPNLTAETSVHYNIGTVIQPNKNWTFTIDQWNFEGKNTIAKLFGDQYTLFENLLEGDIDGLGATINRNPDGTIANVRVPEIVNMGSRTIRGLDLKVDADHKINVLGLPLDLGFTSNHSHFLQYKTLRNELLPIQYRGDLEWKNTTSFSVRSGKHSYRVAARTTAGDTRIRRPAIPTWTEYDFTYGLSTSWGGRISAGVKNALNSRPPVNMQFDTVTFGRPNSAFSPLRRRYFVGYTQSI